MAKNIIIAVLLFSLAGGGYLATTTIGNLKNAITALTIKHKKTILKTKVKERGKRLLATIPVVGLVMVGWFEKQEYDEWKLDNPNGTLSEYQSQMLDAASDVANDIADNSCAELDVNCGPILKRMGGVKQGDE